MKQPQLHPELDERLIELARDITELRLKVSRAKGFEKIQGMAEVEHLEHRYHALAQRLSVANVQGRGLTRGLRAEFEELADRVAGAVEDLISWTDSGYRLSDHSRSGRE